MPGIRQTSGPLCPAVQQGLGPSELWAWRGIVEKGMWDLVFLELIEARCIVTAGESLVLRTSLSQQSAKGWQVRRGTNWNLGPCEFMMPLGKKQGFQLAADAHLRW